MLVQSVTMCYLTINYISIIFLQLFYFHTISLIDKLPCDFFIPNHTSTNTVPVYPHPFIIIFILQWFFLNTHPTPYYRMNCIYLDRHSHRKFHRHCRLVSQVFQYFVTLIQLVFYSTPPPMSFSAKKIIINNGKLVRTKI